MESAYQDGYQAGYNGRSWFSSGYRGRLLEKWSRGFDDGRNAKAAKTMDEWRAANPSPPHGCGHMQGRGAA